VELQGILTQTQQLLVKVVTRQQLIPLTLVDGVIVLVVMAETVGIFQMIMMKMLLPEVVEVVTVEVAVLTLLEPITLRTF
jgi:hypothetical protein